MLLTALFQHSMTPLLHHSMFSFDHPVRPVQHRRRNRQADPLRRLEVDDELELHGLLNGQIGRLGAFQDLVYIDGSAPEQISKWWSIGHKTAHLHKFALIIARW